MSSLGRRDSASLLASLCRAAMAVTGREQFRPERAGTPIGPWRLCSASPRDRRDAGRSWRRARCAAASRAGARSRRPTRPRVARACRSAAHALCSPAVGQRWAHWRSPNRHPPRWAQIVKPDAAATASGSSTVRRSRELLRKPPPPAQLLNWSRSPPTLTVPAQRAVGVRAGGCELACSPRRYQPLRGSSLAYGFACWPSSSSSASAPRLSRCLHHHKPGGRGRAGRRPGGGRRRGQQCFLCRGSRAQCEPRQRFLAARQAPSGPQRSWSSTGLFERPKNLHFGVLDEWCWRAESNREPFAYEATAVPIVLRQRMVGEEGVEPTMDGLKDRYSAIELYPRVGTRPGVRTPNIFVLSEAPLPVGPAARVGDPAGNRTWICAFGERRLVHWATGPEPFPVIETGMPGLEDPAASQRE